MFFWPFRKHRATMQEVLEQIAQKLPLQGATLRKLPVLLIHGDYFDFPVSIELRKRKEFSYRVTVELPKEFSERIFLQSEQRKTKFKPVANLQWVSAPGPRFNQQFLLLASREAIALAVFQRHICQRLLALPESDWQLDLHGKYAHLDLDQIELKAESAVAWLQLLVEVINLSLVAG